MRAKLLILLTLLLPVPTTAGPRQQPHYPPVAAATGPERIGCVWYRQRLDCSRYCYWEVNGKRYCRERERDAHQQGVIEDHFYVVPPMKLGAPRR